MHYVALSTISLSSLFIIHLLTFGSKSALSQWTLGLYEHFRTSYYILSLVITFQVIVSLMVIFISTVCKSWHLISRVENKGISDQSKSVYVKTGPESFIIVAKAHHLKLSFLALYLRN